MAKNVLLIKLLIALSNKYNLNCEWNGTYYFFTVATRYPTDFVYEIHNNNNITI